jgi:CBS-domain-containing membrane protein
MPILSQTNPVHTTPSYLSKIDFNINNLHTHNNNNKKTPWSESASELYRPSDRRLSAKCLPTFADKGCHVVSVTDLYGRILGFIDRSRYFSIK